MTPTKLEIDHAERFEELKLFRDAKLWIHQKPNGGDCILLDSKVNHYFMSADIQELVSQSPQAKLSIVIGPLPSCEELWPVMLGHYSESLCLTDAADMVFAAIGEIMSCNGVFKLPGAMREACLTLFETPQGE